MAISWVQYKVRKRIDVEAWVRANGLRSVKAIKEKLKTLGMTYPSDDSEFRAALKKVNVRKKAPARMPTEPPKKAPRKKKIDADQED